MRNTPFTFVDWYTAVTSAAMVVLGAVILVRTMGYGLHVTALVMAFGFIAFGAYRLSFVLAYLRRRAR